MDLWKWQQTRWVVNYPNTFGDTLINSSRVPASWQMHRHEVLPQTGPNRTSFRKWSPNSWRQNVSRTKSQARTNDQGHMEMVEPVFFFFFQVCISSWRWNYAKDKLKALLCCRPQRIRTQRLKISSPAEHLTCHISWLKPWKTCTEFPLKKVACRSQNASLSLLKVQRFPSSCKHPITPHWKRMQRWRLEARGEVRKLAGLY